MKCIHCQKDIDIVVYEKNKSVPKLMIQVKKTIVCPECGKNNEIEIPFGTDVYINSNLKTC